MYAVAIIMAGIAIAVGTYLWAWYKWPTEEVGGPYHTGPSQADLQAMTVATYEKAQAVLAGGIVTEFRDEQIVEQMIVDIGSEIRLPVQQSRLQAYSREQDDPRLDAIINEVVSRLNPGYE